MRFFKSKKKVAADGATAQSMKGDKSVEVKESLQDLKTELDTAVVPELKAGEKPAPKPEAKPATTPEATSALAAKEATPAPKAETATSATAKPEEASTETVGMVRLFPGFEGEPFEIGYAGYQSSEYGIAEETPMLLMRWKAGPNKWFPLPPMFNKAVLEQIHEEDNDLDRLLIGYGYDAEQLVRKPE